MARGYVVVEGYGETKAMLNLLNRLWLDLALPFLSWAPPIRGTNLHQQRGIDKVCGRVRLQPDVAALLVVRDDEDGCPAESGPQTASWMQTHALPFPAVSVMMYREYETMFLPCSDLMAGQPLRDDRGVERPGLRRGTRFEGSPERLRSAKDWLSQHMDSQRRYKPTLDQLPLTRMIDFDRLRSVGLPCFLTLERALRFLAAHLGDSVVYPPPRDAARLQPR